MRPPSDDAGVAESPDGESMMRKDSMQDSEMTPATETGSISEEENTAGWFGIGSDIKTFARSIKDNVPPAIGGVASFVHRSAMTIASEIAQLERESELETERWREENYGKESSGDEELLHLPWEVPHQSKKLRSSSFETIYEEDEELMKKIFDLSESEDTFLVPYTEAHNDQEEEETDDSSFLLDEARINLIRRLLELDDALAAVHARLSGRSDVKETVFWRNYFYHCERVRTDYLAAKQSALADSLGSLVPACETEKEEDSSFVDVRKNSIASPPSSLNTCTDLSVGDMVLVRAESREMHDLDNESNES